MAKADTGVVNIHGREYKTVALRVTEFRAAHPQGCIETEVLDTGDLVRVKAKVSADGNLLGVGHAEEKRGSSTINKTSALENCETSAVGRALAAAGWIGSEYASADEVAGAVMNQGKSSKAVAAQEGPPEEVDDDLVTEYARRVIAAETAERLRDLWRGLREDKGCNDPTRKAIQGLIKAAEKCLKTKASPQPEPDF